MKIKRRWQGLMTVLLVLTTGGWAATNDVSSTLQKGLFEEEANHNLPAAIEAYQSVIRQLDENRKLAATAIFRLGECYRKQGKTNEAVAQYDRVVREFGDQSVLVTFSQNNLGALQAIQAGPNATGTNPVPLLSSEALEIKRLEAMIKDSPDLINATSPLHNAVQQGQMAVVEFLLQHGVDPNRKDHNQRNALHLAAEAGNKRMVLLLLDSKADVNVKDNNGKTALQLAAGRGYKTVVELLLAAGAEVNARDNAGETALHDAARNGQIAVAELLLANKADVNATSVSGATPLAKGVVGRHLPMVKLLLEKKADPNTARSPEQNFAEGTDDGSFSARLGRIQTKSENWKEANYPLHLAVNLNEPGILKALLEGGANPNRQISGSYVSKNNVQIGMNNWTPLMMAIQEGSKDMVELLLKHKADPNLGSGSTYKPLMAAISKPVIAELLLANGADGTGTDGYGNTALHLAAANGQKRLIQALLAKKMDVNAKGNAGETALHLAVQQPEVGSVEALLAAGADVNPRNQKQETPLHLAVQRQNTNAVELLLNAKADVNARSGYLKTPLGMISPLAANAPAALVQIASLLRKHGGLDDLPREDQIEIRRSSANYSNIVFIKGTNDLNRFTLFEVIAAHYGLIAGDEADSQPNTGMRSIPTRTLRFPGGYSGPGASSGLAFPDFEKLKILSPTPKGFQVNNDGVRYHPNLQYPDCSENKALGWGMVIEIPEADHPINASWQGLTPEFKDLMADCLKREVTLIIKGQATNLVLRPSTNGSSQAQFYLRPVLMNSGLLRTSSDLSKVKVKRHDKTTGQVYELTFDCSDSQSGQIPQPALQYPGGVSSGPGASPAEDLWLRDGDIVEVPDKS